jgi:hypothetical protein
MHFCTLQVKALQCAGSQMCFFLPLYLFYTLLLCGCQTLCCRVDFVYLYLRVYATLETAGLCHRTSCVCWGMEQGVVLQLLCACCHAFYTAQFA